MTSEVQICNRALIKLGADTILDLTDDTNNGRVMNSSYQSVRDAEFDRHRWRFTLQRTSLPALVDAPDSDYARQFELPADYIRLVEGGDILSVADLTDYRTFPSALYSVEGRVILTNLSAPLHIRYIARIVDTALFHTSFCEALSSRLAYECCERITQSDSKKAAAMADYKLALKEAKTANALESPPQTPADDTWMLARLS